MTATSTRRRASDNPETQQRWAAVWIEADRQAPFTVASAPEMPRQRRWWSFWRGL